MIAGAWDDLRTDRRTGDDVYVVQPDPSRVIFRWQAVTNDNAVGPGVSRGENPVNFEIELRRDGTIIMRYGEGNQNLFPVVGISGGEPDTYPVPSHSSELTAKDLGHASTVTFTPRVPVPAPAPDLSVNVKAEPNPVSSGQQIIYTVAALNYTFDFAGQQTVSPPSRRDLVRFLQSWHWYLYWSTIRHRWRHGNREFGHTQLSGA
jgi:hypothetical protein